MSYLLFLEWNSFQAQQKAATQVSEQTIGQTVEDDGLPQLQTSAPASPIATAADDDLPTFDAPSDPVVPATDHAKSSSLISVSTDVFEVLIDPRGGDLVKVALKEHATKLGQEDQPYVLLNRTHSKTYVAQSGLLGPNGTDRGRDRPLFSAEKTDFTLSDSEDQLEVELRLYEGDVQLTKRYSFARGSYLVNIDYLVSNQSSELWRAAPYGQIRRSDFDVETDVGFGMQPYLGAAITTPETNYDKVSFSDIKDEKVQVVKTGGWVAMVQHYFISAWVPDQQAENNYTLRKMRNKDVYILEYYGPVTSIEPGQQGRIQSSFYAGPKHIKTLEKISPFLDLTIDYSWLWFIAKPLFYALDWIHGIVGNWGVAIILLTCLIKLVFFYPSAMSYRSMAKMRKLQPMMADLKERYGDDRQKMSSELMKLYKKEKVNPLGGCLPILLQMPVFIALYWVLMESVELRHAPFMLWIQDLSVKDPYFVLPLIMGATMFIQQKLNPTPPDPMQAKIMQMMPFFFTAIFVMFPAGLVLYWVVNNTLSIAQQYVITRQIEKAG